MQDSTDIKAVDRQEIPYQLIRSRKRVKTLSLKITAAGTVVVQAPYHTPTAEIGSFIERKKRWVLEKLQDFANSRQAAPPKALAPGDSILFMGVSYPLVINDDGNDIALFCLQDGRFILNGRVLHHGKALIRSWYERQAKDFFSARVAHYSQIWEFEARAIRISQAQSRWGSCSPDDRLAFAWRLIMAPPTVIDYVVVHELAHIREKNHSRRFWQVVEKIMPDYEKQRIWLRENGHRLVL